MVFGFNSEVKCDGTVYHVQSEVRATESFLDTQVFVAGRCLGKLANPLPAGETLSDESIHERLKEQHRHVLEAVRAGELEQLFPSASPLVEWLSVQTRADDKTMVARVRIVPAPARVVAQLELDGHMVPADAEPAADGIVELKFPFDGALAMEARLTLQTDASGRSFTQRFRLQRK
jgi:hypothetical protein